MYKPTYFVYIKSKTELGYDRFVDSNLETHVPILCNLS